MTAVPLDELDRLILSKCHKSHWPKTAAVLLRTIHDCEDRELAVTDRQLFDRLVNLVDIGVLEAVGDLSNWRASEVRLLTTSKPDESGALPC